MRKNVWVCGVIGGLISIAWLLYLPFQDSIMDTDYGMLIGYATMLLAFSLIFVAIKNYRDHYNGGVISFGKAFRIGLFISLIASTIYVLAWVIYYFTSGTNFIEEYSAYQIDHLKSAGASPAMIEAEVAKMKEFAQLYQNPFFNALITYTEILPVGLLLSLIAAFVMKRKQKPAITQ